MFPWLRGVGAGLVRALVGGRCPVCGALLPVGQGGRVCGVCAVALAPRLGGFCPRCGELAAEADAPPLVCPSCLAGGRPWAGLAFHGRYEGVLRELILDFKFRGRLAQGRLLAGLCLAACQRALAAGRIGNGSGQGFDLVVPVPLHPRRLAWRGFNQSLELARGLGRALAVPVCPEAMDRIRHTTPQSSLPGPRRRENIQGAFRADPAVVGTCSVLLVDDVMTTGATVETACQALRRAGAVRVDVLVVAR